MGGSRDVSADRHAAAARRGLAQLPADGLVAGSQDRRGDRVTPGGAHPLLRHVDRARGHHSAFYPYGPGAARRDGHVRPGSALELTALPARTTERLANAEMVCWTDTARLRGRLSSPSGEDEAGRLSALARSRSRPARASFPDTLVLLLRFEAGDGDVASVLEL